MAFLYMKLQRMDYSSKIVWQDKIVLILAIPRKMRGLKDGIATKVHGVERVYLRY